MEILMPKTVLAAFVMICVCTLVAKGEADSGKKLIRIMETVSGIASEAIPLAKQEFPLLDAKFKGEQYNNLVAWLRTPVEKASGVVDQKYFPDSVEQGHRGGR